jgi:oxygen-independent coproporphyrinogen-3 oxidase
LEGPRKSAINRFRAAGYEFIGLDHFARPDEALAVARRQGTLCRSFQGMTTGKGLDLLGLGPSSITQLAGAFAQTVKASADWQRAVAEGFATERGLRLSPDDRLRQEVLQQLYCHGTIDKPGLEERFGVAFDVFFAQEMEALRELAEEGLVTLQPEAVRQTEPLGRLLVRVVAAVFDRYLPPGAYRAGLSVQQASRVG